MRNLLKIMNSIERHEARYQRRKAKRKAKKEAFLKKYDDFSRLTSLDNLYEAYHKCTLGVNWKCSTQRYSSKWMCNIMEARRKLLAEEDVRTGFVEFIRRERGKERRIRSVHISERVVQKVLCDQILVPILSRQLIYDNGASLKNRGTAFSLRRLILHLTRYFRQYGADGYALTIDYSGFFDSIPPKELISKIDKLIRNKKVRKLTHDFIYAFGNGKSLGLGSQISQSGAIFYPSDEVDHMVKEELRIQFYGRYMDDIYLVHHSKDYLKFCLERIIRESAKIGLTVNRKKTRIVTLKHGLVFLKGRYSLLDTGKVLRLPCREATVYTQRRLIKLSGLVKQKKMTFREAYNSYESWRGTFRRRFHAFHRVGKMDNLYRKLFLEDRRYEQTL